MTIGERIKERRKKLGLSVEELADKLGKNRATIYRYESSEIEKLPTTVLKPLAKALNTTPAFLMGWDESEKNPQQFKNEDPEKDNKINGTPIKNDRSAVIERINALPDEQFEKFAERAEGYLDGLEDQLSHTPPKG